MTGSVKRTSTVVSDEMNADASAGGTPSAVNWTCTELVGVTLPISSVRLVAVMVTVPVASGAASARATVEVWGT